jgi:oligopeptide transport system ATP-binding protein
VKPIRIVRGTSAPEQAARHRGNLLELHDVHKEFPIGGGLFGGQVVRAVDGVSFEIRAGETLGLVGESGCGKSTLGRVIVQLLPATSGRVLFQGVDLVRLRGEKLRLMRQEMQMIFQDPYASLNPRMTAGEIIAEPLRNFGVTRARGRERRVADAMRICGLNPSYVNRYPHEFSGGQRQRIGIARALVLNPSFIVADEPISALDVSIQAQIVNLLDELQDRFQLTYLFIAHDLSMVRHLSNRVAVMYLGKVVEVGDGNQLYNRPLHPYSGALLSAVPVPNPNVARARKPIVLEGDVPSPINPPSACRFHPRCPRFQAGVCDVDEPQLTEREAGHEVACHYPLETWPMSDLRLEPGRVAAS